MSSYATDRPEGEISAASTEKDHEQEAPATANAAAQPSNTASPQETMEHVHGASVATQVCLSFMQDVPDKLASSYYYSNLTKSEMHAYVQCPCLSSLRLLVCGSSVDSTMLWNNCKDFPKILW